MYISKRDLIGRHVRFCEDAIELVLKHGCALIDEVILEGEAADGL